MDIVNYISRGARTNGVHLFFLTTYMLSSGSDKKIFCVVLYSNILIYIGLGGFRKVCGRDNEQFSRAGMSQRCQL